jgi:phage FluMu protein Com
MFFIAWGSKWEYKVVENGLLINKKCPACQNINRFKEVVPVKRFTLFWAPLFELERKAPLLECENCDEHFYITESDRNYNNAGMIAGIKNPFHRDDNPNIEITDNAYIFVCKKCSQKLQVPKNDGPIHVICPKCEMEFTYKDGAIEYWIWD